MDNRDRVLGMGKAYILSCGAGKYTEMKAKDEAHGDDDILHRHDGSRFVRPDFHGSDL